jgi:hypothetical protein
MNKDKPEEVRTQICIEAPNKSTGINITKRTSDNLLFIIKASSIDQSSIQKEKKQLSMSQLY